MSSDFDRVRPRSPRPAAAAPVQGLDAQGKRALFSSTEISRPGMGSASVDCSRCDERTILGLGQAVRAAVPSLHLGLRFGRGDDVRTISLKRDYPTYMRCPACGRPSWVRFTVQI